MRYLCQGQESRKIIAALLELTKTKENIQGGIYDHFVNNFSVAQAAMLNDVKPNNLSVAIKDLNKKAAICERVNELKCYDKSHTKLNKE